MGSHGATYHGDLTKTVTHLIAASPKGKKYEHARPWGIKAVGIEWMRESIDRGMSLDEAAYHPDIPAERRGVGAVTRKRAPSPVLGKRQSMTESQSDAQDASRRKLRRTASTRLESQTDDMWADMGSGKHEHTAADSLPSKPGHVGRDKERHSSQTAPGKQERKSTTLDSLHSIGPTLSGLFYTRAFNEQKVC